MATFQNVSFGFYKFLKPLNRKGTVLGIKKIDKDDPDLCAKRYPMPEYEFLIEATEKFRTHFAHLPNIMYVSIDYIIRLPSKYINDTDNNLLYLIMERGTSSLGDVIIEMRRQQKYVSFYDFKCIFKSVVSTLHKLHIRKLDHGHIKPNNIIQIGEEETDYYLSDIQIFSTDLKDNEYDQHSNMQIVDVDPLAHDVYRLGITFYEICTLRSPLELRVIKDKTKASATFRDEVKKRYGPKFEEVMFMMVEASESQRIKLDAIVNFHMKELQEQDNANVVSVTAQERAANMILDEVVRKVRDRGQNLEAFFQHYEMQFYIIKDHAFFEAIQDLGITLQQNERAMLKKALDVNSTGEFNLQSLIKTGGTSLYIRELPAAQEKELKELLKEICSYTKDKQIDLRSNFLKMDKKKLGWLDVVTFSEVMQNLKMELANDELKLVCEKYDPTDRGRISYHNFCDDIDTSATQAEMDLTMLILEMYQIIREKFTTLDTFFGKYDPHKKGTINLQDLNKFLADYNISPSSSILQQLYRRIDPDNKNSALYLRIRRLFEPEMDKELQKFLQQMANGLANKNTTFVKAMNEQDTIDTEKLFDIFKGFGVQLKRPDLTFILNTLKIEKTPENKVDVHDLRTELYRFSQKYAIVHSFTFKGSEMQQQSNLKEDSTFNQIIEKLKYKLKLISTPELLSLFDITTTKDTFISFNEFSQKIDEIDPSIESLEKKIVYQKFDQQNEEKVSCKELLAVLGVQWDNEVQLQEKRMQLAELESQVQGFEPEKFEPMRKIFTHMASEIQKLDLTPGQFFKFNKLDQTEFRFRLKQLNIFLADYQGEYERMCKSIAYPSDLNQIDIDKLIRVVEYFTKKQKIEKLKVDAKVSPLRLVILWFEKIVQEMIKQKQDFYIFQDLDQYNYGYIKRKDLESIVFDELGVDSDATFEFFINYIKDDRSGDISLRKLREGIEKERDSRILFEDLVELVKEQRMDVDRIFRNFDFNQSQEMDPKEFERLIRTLQPSVHSAVVEVLFMKFDYNNDKTITLKEFRSKLFGQQILTTNEQKNLVMKHFIEDLDEQYTFIITIYYYTIIIIQYCSRQFQKKRIFINVEFTCKNKSYKQIM